MEEDINRVLKLNGEHDGNGNIICDTSTQLVYNRRQIFQYFQTYIKGLRRRNRLRKEVLQKKSEELRKENPYGEFVGIWLYFLEKKIRSM